jgi:hypothetical protein
VQRLMALRSPKVGELKIDTVIDNRIIRRLDENGFIDKAYAVQGTSSK